uniref:FBA_2 domain-containing protein n=1 Tax=Steinernema glaseri TaxID=37863 RepID=A0A1I7ZE49_9BILA
MEAIFHHFSDGREMAVRAKALSGRFGRYASHFSNFVHDKAVFIEDGAQLTDYIHLWYAKYVISRPPQRFLQYIVMILTSRNRQVAPIDKKLFDEIFKSCNPAIRIMLDVNCEMDDKWVKYIGSWKRVEALRLTDVDDPTYELFAKFVDQKQLGDCRFLSPIIHKQLPGKLLELVDQDQFHTLHLKDPQVMFRLLEHWKLRAPNRPKYIVVGPSIRSGKDFLDVLLRDSVISTADQKAPRVRALLEWNCCITFKSDIYKYNGGASNIYFMLKLNDPALQVNQLGFFISHYM